MLTGDHYGNELNLLINSGVLALLQTLLRQIGLCFCLILVISNLLY
jgi:hypothetical protein